MKCEAEMLGGSGKSDKNPEKNAGKRNKRAQRRARQKGRVDAPIPAPAEGPGFFEDYPRFGETSSIASDIARLDFRYRHVIERNAALLEGKRVLDVASHDGRFVLAALAGAGAAHVTGIEAREHLVTNAAKSLAHYGIAEDRFQLIVGDIFEQIHELPENSIDTAMVLGFLYHTARQYELIAAIARLGAKAIIVDSNVLENVKRPIIRLEWEGTTKDGRIWDASRRKVLSSTPSASALQMFLEEFGYEVEVLEPQCHVPGSAQGYLRGARVTMVGRRPEA